MTGKQLLDALTTVGTVEHAFRFPYAYIRCIAQTFEGMADEEREAHASRTMGRPISEMRRAAADCMFTMQWLTPAEAAQHPIENSGEHWLRAFLDEPFHQRSAVLAASLPSVAHFFGYKGGQGRSTVLACLAQKLALVGARVLVLDADIEAPSLDGLLGVRADNPGSTLLGIVRGAPEVLPVPAMQGRDGGEVRLIACRPRGQDWDIDSAAFAMQAALVPGILAGAAKRIREWAATHAFDVLLLDHRSGMAMATLTWMRALPGPVAIFAKLDEQWRGSDGALRGVLGANPSNPGVIVTFKPDEETPDSFRRRTTQQRSDLLSILGSAVALAAEPGPEEEEAGDAGDPYTVEDRWILWPYDQAFRTTALPDAESIGGGSRAALDELVRLLGIAVPVRKQLSSIGSVDQGDLIQTDALKRLRQPNNGLRYVFGRKGTGKTRLATELAKSGLGEPLLVDAGSQQVHGITTADIEFANAKAELRNAPECLWWALLLAAVEDTDTERGGLRSRLVKAVAECPTVEGLRQRAVAALPASGARVFLVDGIETAFAASEVYDYVEALFLFMLTLQADDRFVGRVEVKLFLRTDLASRSVQNLEQQVEGRVIYLFWDYEKILNFMLSRIPAHRFFREIFPDAVAKIENYMPIIRAGSLSDKVGEEIILQILPQKLPRFNIFTSTFLRLHFADSSMQGPSYYPRVVDSFLKELASAGERRGASALVDGRLDQQLVIRAHEQASADYMNQIRQELQYLLDFGLESPDANRARLDDWIGAFSGRKTPFGAEEMEAYLVNRMSLERNVVRRCLDQMLTLGIFERSPDSPSTWRTGRLFKTSLKMKYKRS